jgi:deoxycytidylate deaminase
MSQVNRKLEVASAAALLSDAPRTGLCLGAALYCGARLLSVGANRWHSHPDSDNADFTKTLHAENVALIRRKHYDAPRGRLTMYVARQREDGTPGCSMPCLNCQKLCKLAGVSRIWYYNRSGKPEEIKL